MNKIILVGRLTAEPQISTGGANNTSIAKYGIAVDRRYKREGGPTADFFNVTSFGKQAEFIGNYMHKGTKVVLEGELQNDNYTNKEGQKVYRDQIICNSIEFAESKKVAESSGTTDDSFVNTNISDDEAELPFS